MEPVSSAMGISYSLLWGLASVCWEAVAINRLTMALIRDLITEMDDGHGAFQAGDEDDLPVHYLLQSSTNDSATRGKDIGSDRMTAGTQLSYPVINLI